VEKLAERLPVLRGPSWTGHAPLPGGDFAIDEVGSLVRDLETRFPFLASCADRLVRAYGTTASVIFAGARAAQDCGRNFGHGLFEREVRHLVDREWVRTSDDVLWRRTKLGLRFTPSEVAALDLFLQEIAP
jgi:glycerol-3-phosphate dehydrogenase